MFVGLKLFVLSIIVMVFLQYVWPKVVTAQSIDAIVFLVLAILAVIGGVLFLAGV